MNANRALVLVALLASVFLACGEASPVQHERGSHIVGVDAGADGDPAPGADAGGGADVAPAVDRTTVTLYPHPAGSRLYKQCTDASQCDADEVCEVVGIVDPNSEYRFCVFKGCSTANRGQDPRCNVERGQQGLCFDVDGSDVCLATCVTSDDCPIGTGCDQAKSACVSMCLGNADCFGSRPYCDRSSGVCIN